MASATYSRGGYEGSLEVTALPVVLTMLADEAGVGVLRIDGGGEVWLDGGRICLVRTAASPDLAKVLYDADLAPAEAVAAALAAGSRPSGQPGPLDALLEARPEVEVTVGVLLHELNLNALFELLVPSRARYRFEAGLAHPVGSRFAHDTRDLLRLAQHRVDIWRRIAARIPSTGATFALAPMLPDGIEERPVSADEWRFLAQLDGRRTVAELIAETGDSPFRVCSSLYRLLLEELIVESVA